jgi:hypothetical protein
MPNETATPTWDETTDPTPSWDETAAVAEKSAKAARTYVGRGDFAVDAGAESVPLVSRYSPAEKAGMEADIKALESPLVSPGVVYPALRGTALGMTAGLSELAPRLTDVLFPKAHAEEVTTGLEKGAADIASSLTTPTNLALLAAGGPISKLGKMGTVLMSSAFEAQALRQAPEQWKQFQDAIANNDYGRATEVGTALLGGVTLPAAAVAIHGAAAPNASLAETLFPTEKPITAPEEVIPNAIKKGQVEQGGVVQHPNAEEGRPAAETSGSDRAEQGGEIPQEVTAQTPAAPAAQLLPGETQGDLISSTQPEDLKLVGEKGTDYSALQAEAEAKAQASEEARLKAEHEQGLLSDLHDYQAQGGNELLDAVEAGGGLPALSSVRSGELSGELRNLREEFSSQFGKLRRGGDYNKIFKSDAPDIDALTEHLRAQGFDVETPAQTLDLIKDRIRTGKPIYASEVRGTEMAAAGSPLERFGIEAQHPLPGFLKSLTDYFSNNTPSQIWNTIKGSIDTTLGKTFAKTTIANREAGEAGARWISAKIAAPHMAETFATQVLDGTGVDPIKFGAALTEDNLRSIRQAAEKEGRPEDAANVSTIIGVKNSPFKTEAEYKAFLADSATQTALARHKELWEQTVDPMYRKAQLLEPDEPLAGRGLETGARINLYNDPEATGKDVVTGTGKGNLTATFRRKSPFAIQAKGTGQSYNVNYLDQMSNTFGRQLEIASKNDFETKLVDSGNAVIGKPGENPTLPDGETAVGFPLKRSVIITAEDGKKVPVNQQIYVRKSLASEYRRGADVDLIKVPGAVKAFANAANQAALAGLTDASVHGLNLMTALFTRPSVAGSALTDSLLSAVGRADVPVTLTKVVTKAFQDNNAQLAELAQIGATRADYPTRNPLGKFIKKADETTRLVMDDAFKKMADSGLVENTETNRREFVNQVGQYNKRAQGDLRRLARDTGLGPFATAGTTFNTLGLRTAALSPGVPATSPMAAAALRANVLSKWVGGVVLAGTLNYLLTKDKGGGVSGREGVPFGSVDSGLNDKNGRPLSFSVFNLLGLGRAMRVTGARGLIESERKGLPLGTAFDASLRDVTNAAVSPFTGPIVRFGTEAASGYQPAVNVPRATHVAAPGDSQFNQNLKDALFDANPILKSMQLAREPGGTLADALRQQVPRLSLTPSQRPEFIEHYPEIVHKAQASAFIDDVVRRARNMNPEARTKFVNDSLDKLTDEDRAHAVKTLKYRKIEY